MRVMLDTNVLISMILFPSQTFRTMLKEVTEKHTLLLSTFVIDELKAVTDRKFPAKRKDIDRFLSELSYELIYTPENMDETLFKIRDMNDYPVLYSAIIADADLFITGDADFSDVVIQRPKILSPKDFFRYYCSQK